MPSNLKVAKYSFLLFYDGHLLQLLQMWWKQAYVPGVPNALVRPNSVNATYEFIASAAAAASESPVEDMTIEMGHNTQKERYTRRPS